MALGHFYKGVYQALILDHLKSGSFNPITVKNEAAIDLFGYDNLLVGDRMRVHTPHGTIIRREASALLVPTVMGTCQSLKWRDGQQVQALAPFLLHTPIISFAPGEGRRRVVFSCHEKDYFIGVPHIVCYPV